ncbi:hypothetical protein BDV93DRAFT_357440 [Ceratobasidium sp. AG-I]|nr:hypothetical protein BDV93DRAFT_357440 [Ceratobasidium sp. AG-I]
MRRLWHIVQPILASTNSTPTLRLLALDSLLKRDEFAEVKRSFGSHGLPNGIDDLRLGHIWFEQLEMMISSEPVLDMDGSIINVMVKHYRKAVPTDQSSEGSPNPNKRIELLNKWQNLNNIFRGRRRA